MLRKLFIFTGILVILGGVFWYTGNDNIPSLEGGKTSESATIISDLDTEKLSSIVLQGGDEAIELIKGDNNQWLVKKLNYAADTKKINKLILDLLKTKLAEKVTDQAKHHERFQLVNIKDNDNKWDSEKMGTLISLRQKDGSPLLEILVGKDRSNKNGYRPGQYIRYTRKPEVFLITENISPDIEEEDWLDDQIVNIDSDTVKTVELQLGIQISRIARENKDEEWVLSNLLENDVTSQSKSNALSSAAANLTFETILPNESPLEKTGRETLAYYTVELFDGRIFKISIGDQQVSDDNYYYLSIAMALRNDIADETLQKEVSEFNQRSSSWLYAVNSWIGKRFLVEHSEIIEKKENNDTSQ